MKLNVLKAKVYLSYIDNVLKFNNPNYNTTNNVEDIDCLYT